jgi:hypothetical protein
LYNNQKNWAQYGVHGCSFVLGCVLQSLLMVIVGFTFPDDQVPTDFIPHWDDWLGETLESFQDWRTGPFYQHLPDQKGILKKLFTFLRSLHALHNMGPISVYVCTEDVIQKKFQILPPSFSSKLLEFFSSNFWKRGKVVGSLKVSELGSELSWLPLT